MISTPIGYFHSSQCRFDYATKKPKELKVKADKFREDKNKKEKKEFNTNDIPKQLKLTQKSFNKLRVLQELEWFNSRGIEPYCISCGKTHMDWCCGHYKTVGSQGRLRFDERNTFLQCNRYCNMALSGNISGNKNTHGYTEGLIIRFGAEAAGNLIDYCETNTAVKKWNGPELQELRAGFNKQIKGLNA